MTNQPVTLITGTSRGIGLFLAEHYIEKGHQIIGCSRSGIDWQHKSYQHFEVDVTNEKDIKQMISSIRKEYGQLDNLINNAGIAAMNHALLTPAKTIENVLQTNVIGTFLFSREAAKIMQKKHYGRIVNFSTVAVPLKLEGEAIYAASKSAVVTLTQILAKEFAPFGITVNSVGPTPIQTDLIKAVPKEKIEDLIARQSIKRLGKFEDVANVIDFYLQRDSGFITGQTLYLGGV